MLSGIQHLRVPYILLDDARIVMPYSNPHMQTRQMCFEGKLLADLQIHLTMRIPQTIIIDSFVYREALSVSHHS